MGAYVKQAIRRQIIRDFAKAAGFHRGEHELTDVF